MFRKSTKLFYWSCRNFRAKMLLVASALMFCTLPMAAQQTGQITGTIVDATGSVIPGAKVTAKRTSTQQQRVVATNGAGSYVIPYLQPGSYAIVVEKSGFQQVSQSGIDVQVGGSARVDISMPVGSETETLVVTSTAPLLTRDSVALGTVIETKQITDLPLNGRDYLSLVALGPNVVAEAVGGAGSAFEGGARAATSLAVGGQRLEFNHYTLDGVENTDPNFNSYIIHPSIDAIQEFKILNGVYSAEFGKGASQINVTTLPGSNRYHLVAFEFIRNAYVDAKAWRQQGAKNPFKRNQFGFTLSGPMSIPKIFNGKDRLFFMANFEGDRDRVNQQELATVPTAAIRSGDFSASGQHAIYIPSTRVQPVGSTPGSATQFSYNGVLNVIPPTAISQQAKNLLAYYPLPTNGNASNNYVRQALSPTDSTNFTERVDFNQSPKIMWFERFSWGSDAQTSPAAFITDTITVASTVYQSTLANTYVISPTMVNEARLGWSEFQNNVGGYFSYKQNIQATLGITGLYASSPIAYGVPSVTIGSGISSMGGLSVFQESDDLYDFVDGLSLVRGKHAIKIGGEIGRDRFNQLGNQTALGAFSFDGASTNNPSTPLTTGISFADFLVGLPSQPNRVIALANAMLRRSRFAAYVQDDWKFNSRLTVNAGFRYENTPPWVDKHDDMISPQVFASGVTVGPWGGLGTTPAVSLNPSIPQPILTRPGSGGFYDGLNFQYGTGQAVQRGNQYMGRALVGSSNLNFGPRVGFSYAPTDKWNLRAGYGIFFASDISNPQFDVARNLGGKDAPLIPSSARTVTLAAPWASETSASCPGYVGACLVAPQIQTVSQHNKTPYVQQYMLNVQRQIARNTAIEVGYLGNVGRKLGRAILVNQAIPKTGPTDTRTIAQRTPFPNYGVFQTYANVVSAGYNAGSLKLTQQLSHGLQYTVGFTYSRSIDDGSAIRNDGNDFFIPTNTYNLRAERGPSEFNMPRRFVASYLYILPIGVGQRFLNEGVVGRVIGGWQLGGILTMTDGTPRNWTRQGDTDSLNQSQGNIPDATGISPIPAHRSAAQFWNIAAASYTNADLTWRPGSMGRNTLTTPGNKNFDASLSRDVKLGGRQNLNIRFEAFNVPNHPNWSPPANDGRNASTFGVITAAKSMRQLQLAAKYSF